MPTAPPTVAMSSPTSTRHCRLFTLPYDVLALIVKKLPTHTRMVLAHTYAAHEDIFRCTPKTPLRRSRVDLIKYLTCIARDHIYAYVCKECADIHVHELWDATPRKRRRTLPGGRVLAPRRLLQRRWCDYVVCRSGPVDSYMDHRHVQLTLKMIRLGPSNDHQARILKMLLEPYRVPIPMRGLWGLAKCLWDPSDLLLHPKVVDGRYLLMADFAFRNRVRALEFREEDLGSFRLCHHLEYGGRYGIPCRHECWQAELARGVRWVYRQCEYGWEYRGACLRCPIDFAVQLNPEGLSVRAWADLGVECSPLDPVWEALFGLHGGHHPEPRTAGGIRKMYESGKGDQGSFISGDHGPANGGALSRGGRYARVVNVATSFLWAHHPGRMMYEVA